MVYGSSLTGRDAFFANVFAFELTMFLKQTILFIDCISIRESLRILFENSLTFSYALIKLIIYFYWTNGSTRATTRTFFCVNITCLLFNGYSEIPCFTFCFGNLRISIDANIEMASAFY